MSDGDDRGIRLTDSYIAERDRMLKDIEAQAAKAEEVPWALRGFYRVVLAVAKVFVPPIFAFFAGTTQDVKDGINLVTTGEALKVEIKRDDDWWKPVLEKFGFPQSTIDAIASIMPEIQSGPVIFRTLPSIMLIVGLFGRLGAVVSGEPAKDLMRRYHPNTPSPHEILKAAFIDPSRYDQVVKALQQTGLTNEDIDLLFVSNYQLYQEQYVRALFYRGVLSEEQANNRLSELGFTPDRIEELKAGWPIIPGIQDLIMMQAKEAFEPELIAKFGLGAEAPTDIYEWTRKLGLPDEWTNKYWTSHWIHPSYQQVMEMLHRGFIEWEDVYEWYKLVEIPPYWRELLTKVAYSPYTRVDVRRMHKAGVIGDDELIQAMKDIGYDQEHAEKMAEFYKRYNAGAGKELSRSDIEKAYEDRDLSYTESIGLLKSIGYSEELAIFYISRIELEMQRSARLERIDLAKEKYLSNLFSESETRNYLVGSGIEVKRVNELLDRWTVQIIKNAKLPSKTDLDKFVRAGVIDEDGYRIEMKKLGYSDYYINLYWKYIEAGGAE
jgi:hypothetical protein